MQKFPFLSARLLVGAVQRSSNSWSAVPELIQVAPTNALQCWKLTERNLYTSPSSWQEKTPVTTHDQVPTYRDEEPKRKFGAEIQSKELWHEAWMYEDRFGTADDPVVVPSLEPERVIGCTDPEDDNLVVWGILREGEPPKQFVEDGEYYLLKRVSYVKRVGDVLMELANEKSAGTIAA